MLPRAVASSTSPVNWPAVIDTVAPARFWLSGSLTEREGDSVRVSPVTNETLAAAATVGGSFTAVIVTVVIAGVLKLNEPAPSLTAHLTVRVGSAPKSSGLSLVDVKVTES